MDFPSRPGKINLKLLILLGVCSLVFILSILTLHQVRKRTSISEALTGGIAAWDRGDWPSAVHHFKRYLARYPDDVTILEKFARAHLAVRPLKTENIKYAIHAWRNLVRLKPGDAEPYYQLFILYNSIRDYPEIAYIAQKRLKAEPGDCKAALWLAKALLAQRKQNQAREILVALIQNLENGREKRPEYCEACILLSSLSFRPDSSQSFIQSKQWLDRALRYDPNNLFSLLNRARFYRTCRASDQEQRKAFLTLIRADLDRIAFLKPEDPGLRLMVCAEWINIGEFGLAAAELDTLKSIDDRTVLKYFSDINDWLAARFLQEAEVSLRTQSTGKGIILADTILNTIHSPPHRALILPSVIKLFLVGKKVVSARRSLDEYCDLVRSLDLAGEHAKKVVHLQTLVGAAEKKT